MTGRSERSRSANRHRLRTKVKAVLFKTPIFGHVDFGRPLVVELWVRRARPWVELRLNPCERFYYRIKINKLSPKIRNNWKVLSFSLNFIHFTQICKKANPKSVQTAKYHEFIVYHRSLEPDPSKLAETNKRKKIRTSFLQIKTIKNNEDFKVGIFVQFCHFGFSTKIREKSCSTIFE